MSYDLRRLRLHGLIQRLPHSNKYVLTPDGIRVAVFYTKLHNRLMRPLLNADKPPANTNIRQPSQPSNTPSTTTPTPPASQPELVTTSHIPATKKEHPGHQEGLHRCPGRRPEPVAPSGQSGRHARLTPSAWSGSCAWLIQSER